MNRPPMLLTLKLCSNAQKGRPISLWLPLFIIIPIILLICLALLLMILPILLVYILVTWDTRWWRYLRYRVPAFFQTMYAFLGLKIEVEDNQQQFYIDIN